MQVMIRCKVRPDGVEAGLELLQEVYKEMRSVRPKGLRHGAGAASPPMAGELT
jgi:hypothetical protein